MRCSERLGGSTSRHGVPVCSSRLSQAGSLNATRLAFRRRLAIQGACWISMPFAWIGAARISSKSVDESPSESTLFSQML